MEMKYNIAIASTDGKIVNQHFGRANRFLIFLADDEEKTYQYIETRNLIPTYYGENYKDEEFHSTVEILKDCKYVLVSKIGASSRIKLENRGIEAYELPGVITKSIVTLLNYLDVRNQTL